MIIYSPEAATRIEVTYKATGLPHDNAWGTYRCQDADFLFSSHLFFVCILPVKFIHLSSDKAFNNDYSFSVLTLMGI